MAYTKKSLKIQSNFILGNIKNVHFQPSNQFQKIDLMDLKFGYFSLSGECGGGGIFRVDII